jgi:hypothetical protein
MNLTPSIPNYEDEILAGDQGQLGSGDKPEQTSLFNSEYIHIFSSHIIPICLSGNIADRTEQGVDESKRSKKSKKVASRKNAITLQKRKKKERKLMTPLEYILKLQESVDDMKEGVSSKIKKRPPQFLKGKTIFYVGGDNQWASATTRGRLNLVSSHCFFYF